MRVSVLVALSTLALALSPLACASNTDDTDPENVSSPPEDGDTEDELKSHAITDDDNGKTFTIAKGQSILVSLGSNPTTGFKWAVTSTDRTFGYPVSERFVKNGGKVGSGGLQRFTWKTSASPLNMVGSHTVKLEYRRSFETEAAPAKTFTFTVKIVDESCPQVTPPAAGFCKNGKVQLKTDAKGCAIGYDCIVDCRANACGSGRSCQYCWGKMACVPNGALC